MIAGMYSIAEMHWPTITARYYMVDLLSLPMTKFLDLIFAWCYEQMPSQEEWEKFLIMLETPMPGSTRQVSDTVAEHEGEDFMAAMTMLNAGG